MVYVARIGILRARWCENFLLSVGARDVALTLLGLLICLTAILADASSNWRFCIPKRKWFNNTLVLRAWRLAVNQVTDHYLTLHLAEVLDPITHRDEIICGCLVEKFAFLRINDVQLRQILQFFVSQIDRNFLYILRVLNLCLRLSYDWRVTHVVYWCSIHQVIFSIKGFISSEKWPKTRRKQIFQFEILFELIVI